MKFCIVAYKFGTEKEIGEHLGTYHYFIEITRQLVKAGHEVYVIAPWLSFFRPGSTNVDGVNVIRYYPPLWNRIWAFPLNRLLIWWYLKQTSSKVLNFVKENKPDVVLVWQARETGYAVAKIKNQFDIPFIFRQITTWQWHLDRSSNEVFGKKSWYRFFSALGLSKLIDGILEFLLNKKSQKEYADLIYRQADSVSFVSEIASQEGLAMGLLKSKISILPVCIETEIFKPLGDNKEILRQQLGIRGSKVILFIGRINFAEKGIGYLLEAMAKIVGKVPEANLVIIGGGGESERMEKTIRDLNIEKNVQLVGKKPFNDLAKYINACDVFAVPSVWLETFGQVTIEAMACGVPAVTFDAGASPYINIDGQTGFVIPSKDSDRLAEAIIKLLDDKQLREKFGQAARQRVLDNYTYKAVIDKLLNIIKEVKNGK